MSLESQRWITLWRNQWILERMKCCLSVQGLPKLSNQSLPGMEVSLPNDGSPQNLRLCRRQFAIDKSRQPPTSEQVRDLLLGQCVKLFPLQDPKWKSFSG